MIFSSLVQLPVAVVFARNVALPTLHWQRSHLPSTHLAPYFSHCSSVQLCGFWHSKLVNVSIFPRWISKDAVTVFPLIQTTRHSQYQTKLVLNAKAIYVCVNRNCIWFGTDFLPFTTTIAPYDMYINCLCLCCSPKVYILSYPVVIWISIHGIFDVYTLLNENIRYDWWKVGVNDFDNNNDIFSLRISLIWSIIFHSFIYLFIYQYNCYLFFFVYIVC